MTSNVLLIPGQKWWVFIISWLMSVNKTMAALKNIPVGNRGRDVDRHWVPTVRKATAKQLATSLLRLPASVSPSVKWVSLLFKEGQGEAEIQTLPEFATFDSRRSLSLGGKGKDTQYLTPSQLWGNRVTSPAAPSAQWLGEMDPTPIPNPSSNLNWFKSIQAQHTYIS